MQKTTNYQLNQWEKDDRIQMEDFNADNLKIEQALAEHSEAQAEMMAALTKCGNCKIVYGSYTGNGNTGSSNPNELSFDGTPIYVYVVSAGSGSGKMQLHLLRGITYTVGLVDNSRYNNTVSWTDRSVRWYSADSYAGTQFNASDSTYYYFALIQKDA